MYPGLVFSSTVVGGTG